MGPVATAPLTWGELLCEHVGPELKFLNPMGLSSPTTPPHHHRQGQCCQCPTPPTGRAKPGTLCDLGTALKQPLPSGHVSSAMSPGVQENRKPTSKRTSHPHELELDLTQTSGQMLWPKPSPDGSVVCCQGRSCAQTTHSSPCPRLAPRPLTAFAHIL